MIPLTNQNQQAKYEVLPPKKTKRGPSHLSVSWDQNIGNLMPSRSSKETPHLKKMSENPIQIKVKPYVSSTGSQKSSSRGGSTKSSFNHGCEQDDQSGKNDSSSPSLKSSSHGGTPIRAIRDGSHARSLIHLITDNLKKRSGLRMSLMANHSTIEAAEPPPLRSFYDNYEFEQVEKVLGVGNFSTVKMASDLFTDDKVAIKVISKKNLGASDLLSIENEVRLQSRLTHKSVVRMLDFFDEDEDFLIVMECVPGGSLYDKIVEKEYFMEEEAKPVVYDILSALEHIHSKNIIHRDMKPENVMVFDGDDGYFGIKVADFGSAYEIIEGDHKYMDVAVGSWNYMAPEMLNDEAYGKLVDIWAVGVLTFALLGGYLPFDEENHSKLFKKIRKGDFWFQPDYWDHVSEQGKEFIRAMLQADPSKRPTAREAMKHPWLAGWDPESRQRLKMAREAEAESYKARSNPWNPWNYLCCFTHNGKRSSVTTPHSRDSGVVDSAASSSGHHMLKFSLTPGKAPPLSLHISVSPSLQSHDSISTTHSGKSLESVMVGFEEGITGAVGGGSSTGTNTARSIAGDTTTITTTASSLNTTSQGRKKRVNRRMRSDSMNTDEGGGGTSTNTARSRAGDSPLSTPGGSRAGSRRGSWKSARMRPDQPLSGSNLHSYTGTGISSINSAASSFSLHMPPGYGSGSGGDNDSLASGFTTTHGGSSRPSSTGASSVYSRSNGGATAAAAHSPGGSAVGGGGCDSPAVDDSSPQHPSGTSGNSHSHSHSGNSIGGGSTNGQVQGGGQGQGQGGSSRHLWSSKLNTHTGSNTAGSSPSVGRSGGDHAPVLHPHDHNDYSLTRAHGDDEELQLQHQHQHHSPPPHGVLETVVELPLSSSGNSSFVDNSQMTVLVRNIAKTMSRDLVVERLMGDDDEEEEEPGGQTDRVVRPSVQDKDISIGSSKQSGHEEVVDEGVGTAVKSD